MPTWPANMRVTMEPVAYFRAVLRRWWLVAICVVVCAAIGYGTTLFHSEKAAQGRTYYKATTTLSFSGYSSSNQGALPPAVSNLDQIAILATTGDVPDNVAAALSTPETG